MLIYKQALMKSTPYHETLRPRPCFLALISFFLNSVSPSIINDQTNMNPKTLGYLVTYNISSVYDNYRGNNMYMQWQLSLVGKKKAFNDHVMMPLFTNPFTSKHMSYKYSLNSIKSTCLVRRKTYFLCRYHLYYERERGGGWMQRRFRTTIGLRPRYEPFTFIH